MESNDLYRYFKENSKRLIHKWNHYFDIYEKHFSIFRNKEVIIVEIGVSHGGSLQMWKQYFGKNARIIGIDVDARCKQFEEENIEIYIGSQSDKNFLKKLKNIIPKIDILIDDGSHNVVDQIITFKELFDYISNDGIYLCEDIHTSYWTEYGGGYKKDGTFVEFAKSLIDSVNAYHSKEEKYQVDKYTQSIDCINFYDSIVVIQKKIKDIPTNEMTGYLSLVGNK